MVNTKYLPACNHICGELLISFKMNIPFINLNYNVIQLFFIANVNSSTKIPLKGSSTPMTSHVLPGAFVVAKIIIHHALEHGSLRKGRLARNAIFSNSTCGLL